MVYQSLKKGLGEKILHSKVIKKLTAIMLFVMVTISSTYTYANLTGQPVQEGTAIVVTGRAPAGKAGINVTAVVLKKNISAVDLEILPLQQTLDFIGQTITSVSGNYRFEVLLPDSVDTGNVLLRFGSGYFEAVQEANIDYIPLEKIRDAITQFNHAYSAQRTQEANRAAMAAALNSPYLGLESTGVMGDYVVCDKNVVYDYLLKVLEENDAYPTSIEAISSSSVEIRNRSVIGTGLASLNVADSDTRVDSLLTKYAQIIGLNTGEYDALDSGSYDIGKKSVCNFITTVEIRTKNEAQKALDDGVAIGTLNSSISWDNARIAIETYADRFGIPLESDKDFKAVKDKKEVYKIITDAIPFNEIESVYTAFNDAVDEVLGQEQNADNRRGGGGERKGSGTTVSVISAPVTPVSTPTITTTSAQFIDIESVPWAKEGIEKLAQSGVLKGPEEGKFAPELPVTRAEYLKMLMKALNVKSSGKDVNFTDVGKDEWYYTYIADASAIGVVYGNSSGSFGANDQITRQDMAVMAVRAIKTMQLELPTQQEVAFEDDTNIAQYASEQVYILAKAGIINGMGDGRFEPLQNATRAQAAKIVYTIFKLTYNK